MGKIYGMFLTLNLLGIGLIVLLWHILNPGLMLDASGLHLTNGQDFLNYWAAPQIAQHDITLLFTGRDGYEQALRQLFSGDFQQMRWSYPLYSLFFYAPFASLPYGPALILWSITGLALYLAVTRLALPPAHRTNALLLLAAAPITLIELLTRQNGFFIGAASLGVLLLLDRRRPVAAGILLGCLTIKPQLFILWPLVLVLNREWRCILTATLTLGFLLGLSLLLHGVDAWAHYFAYLGDKQWQLLSTDAFNESRKLYHLMMPGVMPALRILNWPEPFVTLLQIFVSAAVAIATLFALKRKPAFAERALILATASLLVSPYSFNYDMTLLTSSLILFLATRTIFSLYDKLILGIAYLLPVLVYILNVTDLPLAPIFLLLLFVVSLRASPTPSAAV